MKQVFTLILFVLTLGVQAQLSLTVDVSCSATPNPSSVRMTGAFWGVGPEWWTCSGRQRRWHMDSCPRSCASCQYGVQMER